MDAQINFIITVLKNRNTYLSLKLNGEGAKMRHHNESSLGDILDKARFFHGHVCPFLALGIKASLIAMKRLSVQRLGFNESVGEDILAIVECNNCFTDGVQVVTGCTIGNNCLLYFDLGKVALTLVRRSSWDCVRVYVDSQMLKEEYFSEETLNLFRKVVVRRKGSRKDRKILSQKWEKLGYEMLNVPEDKFKISRVKVSPIERAPVFKSIRCESCKELVMETRVTRISGKNYCLKCAGKKYRALIGRGIVEVGG